MDASKCSIGWITAIVLATLLAAPLAQAQPGAAPDDPVLLALVRDALARNPDLARARLQVEAEAQRVPQAASLPDPTLSLGWQNDGFSFEFSEMGDTFATIMATQPLPYPGKRHAREQVAAAAVDISEALLERIRMRLTAQVWRSYAGLLLVHGQLRLLEDQEALWQQAEAISRARNEVGQGSQLDLLRAQLERTRLAQTRARLQSEARTRLLELNRLAVRPLDAALETQATLEALALPEAPTDAVADAERRSPELAAAQREVRRAEKQAALSKLEQRPDLALSAGVMPRGLAIEPMWQVGVSFTLPVWAKSKQDKALAESRLQAEAGRRATDEVRQVLAQRTRERVEQLGFTQQINGMFKAALLPRSEATVRAALAQYGVGRAPFVSVLEALNGLFADRGAYLASLAQAHALVIALHEASLDPTTGIGAGASMAAPGMPGSGGGGARPGAASAPAPGGSAPASSGGSGMSAM